MSFLGRPDTAMEPSCDFCKVMRAVVYCNSDSARLCLYCDDYVHSANSLAERHPRSLLCDKCNSRSAITRCMDEKMSLCEDCDRNGSGCSGLGHTHQPLNGYTGCPSWAEFTRLWSSALELPCSNEFNSGWGLLNLKTSPVHDNNNAVNSILENGGNEDAYGNLANENLNELEPWAEPPRNLPPVASSGQYCQDQTSPVLPGLSLPPKVSTSCRDFKNFEVPDSDDLCRDLNVEGLPNFGTADNILGNYQPDQAQYEFEDGDMESLLLEENLTGAEPSGPIENNAIEVPSVQHDLVGFQPSIIGSSVLGMQSITNPCCSMNFGLGYPRQLQSSMPLPLPSIAGTGENMTADNYQDCGVQPLLSSIEAPWESNLEISCPQARDKAKMRYNEKKKTRTFGKQIRYASRKARADTRKRVKGRFVKAGEAYDYDPMGTSNFSR